MSQDDVLVKVEGVSKVFCRDLKKSLLYGAQDVLGELNPFSGRNGTENGGARKLRKGEFYAVKDVSFELKRGECLGLIGRNGAGKTTLLKMLNGLIKPDEGRIEMRGRVGALIALGAGFNPILTGRENVYVNGSVLGLTKKEIDAKFKEIVEFAEIGEFIDSPVQSYSSGMQVRLGFAVASTLKSDVLLLDEVLAVGDFKFRQKCLRRIAEILKDCAVVFVSHNFDQLERVCTRGLVLERGNCISDTNITKARQVYDELTENTKDKTGWIHECITIQNPDKTDIFHVNKDHIKLKIQLIVKEIEAEVVLRIRFRNSEGNYVAEYHSLNHRIAYKIEPGVLPISVEIPIPPLKGGCYIADFFLSASGNELMKFVEMPNVGVLEILTNPYGFDSVQV